MGSRLRQEMMTKNKAWLNLAGGDAVWADEEAEAVGVDWTM